MGVLLLAQLIYLNSEGSLLNTDPFVVNDKDYELIKSISEEKEYKKNNTTKQLSAFDPNLLTQDGWRELGFSIKQSQSILKYKNSINGFKSKQDLKNVFVISDNKYTELEPYITIQTFIKNQQEENLNKIDSLTITVAFTCELNTASKDDLIKIKGIGAYTANAILKYKETIGGYHSLFQLKEVYGVSDENFNLIKDQISINDERVTKILVNEWSIPKLKKHPYISWDLALEITNKRLSGKLTSLQFLVDDNSVLSQSELDNLLPYIKY